MPIAGSDMPHCEGGLRNAYRRISCMGITASQRPRSGRSRSISHPERLPRDEGGSTLRDAGDSSFVQLYACFQCLERFNRGMKPCAPLDLTSERECVLLVSSGLGRGQGTRGFCDRPRFLGPRRRLFPKTDAEKFSEKYASTAAAPLPCPASPPLCGRRRRLRAGGMTSPPRFLVRRGSNEPPADRFFPKNPVGFGEGMV